jgi:hypothetical protein
MDAAGSEHLHLDEGIARFCCKPAILMPGHTVKDVRGDDTTDILIYVSHDTKLLS